MHTMTHGACIFTSRTRVDKTGSVVDVVPQRTALDCVVYVWRGRQRSSWWEDKTLVQEIGVAALVGAVVDVGNEALVKVDQRPPVIDERGGRNLNR